MLDDIRHLVIMSGTNLNRRIRHCCCCEKRLTGRFVELGVCKKCGIEQDKMSAEIEASIARRNAEFEARVYLSVTRPESDEAREMGAMWDSGSERWYAPTGEPALVRRWPLNSDSVVLTGEDREYGGNELCIDLIPATSWATIRSCVHPRDWDRLCRHVCERVKNCCEYCGMYNDALAIREKWHYIGKTRTQKLVRLIAMCYMCHLASCPAEKDLSKSASQLAKLRKWNKDEIMQHYIDARWLNRGRIAVTWTTDLSLLTDNGISLVPDLIQVQQRHLSTLASRS